MVSRPGSQAQFLRSCQPREPEPLSLAEEFPKPTVALNQKPKNRRAAVDGRALSQRNQTHEDLEMYPGPL